MGRHSVSSLPRETGRAPVASVNRANFLSWSFIGSLCKTKNISLFLSSVFLSSTFFPYLSINPSPTPFLLRVSLDPAEAGPRQETVKTVKDFIWGGSKITGADGDCSHEIKRHLLLGRKAMIKLRSISKSRYYFANEVHLV